MRNQISLRTRLLFASAVAVAAILVTAGSGLVGLTRSNEGLSASLSATTAVRTLTQALHQEVFNSLATFRAM